MDTGETDDIYHHDEETNAKNTLRSYFVYISKKLILYITTSLNCLRLFGQQ